MATSSQEDPCAREGGGEPYNMPLHIAAIFIEIGVSFLGTLIPVIMRKVPRLRIGEFFFQVGKNFGTGVILATAFIHMLGPAAEALTNECLPAVFNEEYRSFSGLFALAAILTVQFVQSLAVNQARKAHSKLVINNSTPPPVTKTPQATEQQPLLAPPGPGLHDAGCEETHVHTLMLDAGASRKISTYMLELGIATHSVIIGIALGISRGDEFRGLLIALAFHQFFEGIALSTTVLDSGFKSLAQPIGVIVFYSLTTPAGIALGVGLSRTYNENGVASLLTQGIFDAVSAGILIYDALVNMLSLNITHSKEFTERSAAGKVVIFLALWTGAAIMAVIGRWA